MSTFADLLDRLEQLLVEVEQLDEPARGMVLEVLDGIDVIHRTALSRLPDALDDEEIARVRAADPALGWLLDVYGVGTDERVAAEQALEEVRPFVSSHGGAVEVVEAREGIVRVRMSGACSGCSASAVTLQHGVERALRDHMPGFVGLEVEDDDAAEHPPPGPTLLQVENRLE